MFAGVIEKQTERKYSANIAPGPEGHRHIGNTRDVSCRLTPKNVTEKEYE